VPPVAGTLIAFAADMVHEVTPVRGAPRDAIVDWCLTPRRAGE
jgi:predicted 2-oxoglutarate/Fe(II)-dependent dioxygenase YbiX